MNTTAKTNTMRIIHIMRDGEVRDSIEGLTPPPENRCYEVLRNIIDRERKEKKCS